MSAKIKGRKVINNKSAHSCEIFVVKNGEEIKLATASANIVATEKSTILSTNKFRYPVLEREYTLVICNIKEFSEEPTIEYLDDVEMYNIMLTFVVDGITGAPVTITDAKPEKIDLYGEWQFSLTDKEREKIEKAINGTA